MYAAHNPDVDAAVAWYGRVGAERSCPGDKNAQDVAGQIKAPVLGLYGGADAGIPNDTVEKFFASLKAAGNTRSEVRDLSRHAACVPRRLPADVPQGQGRGRLEARDRLVQAVPRLIDAGS